MVKIKNKQLSTLLILTACLLSTSTWAKAEPLYNFELIVFKYTNLDYFSSESWNEEWQNIDLTGSLDLEHGTLKQFLASNNKTQLNIAKQFKKLSSSEHTLGDSLEAIKNSSRYELLSYLAWQQPGLDSKTTIPIRIRSQQQFDELQPIRKQVVLSDAKQESISEQILMEPKQHYELDGTVKVVMTRFLHVYLDLRLLIPAKLESIDTNGEDSETSPTAFRIKPSEQDDPEAGLFGINFKAHRRMRSRELHHIDHPLLGAIIIATPVKTD